ncbi:MAG: hypothetical protein V4568_17115 [Pseudomonadota bacterium]
MSLLYSRIKETKDNITHSIETVQSDLLTAFPIQRCIDLMDSYKGYGKYGYFPDTLQQHCKEIIQRTSTHTLENYNKLLMLTFMESFGVRSSQRSLPASVIRLFSIEFDRMIDEMNSDREGYYLFSHDAFLKDLGMCRCKLYPCGAELLDERSGVPKSILLRNGIKQLIHGSLFFLINGNGFRPYYELHMHAPFRQAFTDVGWIRSYLRIADLLQLNPHVKGISCTSWWYDPQVSVISPRLSYLRQQPLEGRAKIFYVALDAEAAYGAIEKSEKRRALYEAGKYVPKLYMMVWARDDLINWTKQFRVALNDSVQMNDG